MNPNEYLEVIRSICDTTPLPLSGPRGPLQDVTGCFFSRNVVKYIREAETQLVVHIWPFMATSFFILALRLASVVGLHNGVARTPPMGWNPYNVYLWNTDEVQYRAVAHAPSCPIELERSRLQVLQFSISTTWGAQRDDSMEPARIFSRTKCVIYTAHIAHADTTGWLGSVVVSVTPPRDRFSHIHLGCA
ncbi:hypothetical protein HD554DRAFT_1773466 [Boletus coccyginus]|nr:hypothetical protein HD554DRAFT_1773466 [Boletus coccyginus]